MRVSILALGIICALVAVALPFSITEKPQETQEELTVETSSFEIPVYYDLSENNQVLIVQETVEARGDLVDKSGEAVWEKSGNCFFLTVYENEKDNILTSELSYSLTKVGKGQDEWEGTFNEEPATGYVGVEVYDDEVILNFFVNVEPLGDRPGIQSIFRVGTDPSEVGIGSGGFRPVGVPGKTCVCFGDSATACSDEACDLAEKCTTGKKPVCKWQSGGSGVVAP